MPGGNERDGGVFRDRSGWRIGFALAWCGLLASTIAACLLLGGASTARGVFLVGVAVGEFVLALISSVLLEHTVFHPIERLREAIAEDTDGPLPAAKGPLAPPPHTNPPRQEPTVAPP